MQDASLIFHYFPGLSDIQKIRFNQLGRLYKLWNARVNVISRKDIDNLYVHHILHSLGIAKVIQFKPGSKILDVGTGGGFPGIPLAILFPEVHFHLIDSIGKKIHVVNDVAHELGLKNVSTEQIRAEELDGKYDFVVSRAVVRMKEFYGWVRNRTKKDHHHSRKNGILFLKGGNLNEELAELKRPYQLYELGGFFTESFFETKKVVYVPN